MFSPFPDYLLWAVVFILESAAAYLTFPRQKVLSLLLAFRAAADLLGMVLLGTAGNTAFQWEDYLQRMIQFPILAILAVCCAGAICGDHRGVKIYSLPISTVVAVGIAAVHGMMAWNLSTVFWIEEKAVFVIASLLSAAIIFRWIDRRCVKIPAPWGETSAGLLVLLASYALGSMAREHHWAGWMTVSRWTQLGTILAYAIWIAEPIKAESGELRLWLAKLFAGRRKHMQDATATIERLIERTANNSYGKAQRIMARRIIEELRRTQ